MKHTLTVKRKKTAVKKLAAVQTVIGSEGHIPAKAVVNKAGGRGYDPGAKYQLLSLLSTCFLDDQFYSTKADQAARVRALVQADPYFAAKAAVWVRKVFGMRSVTHLVGSEVVHCVKGEPWTAPFINTLVYRLDDAVQILAAYLAAYPAGADGKKRIPNSLKKGIRAALGRYDSYAFAKYKLENQSVKLVDLVNLVHPIPNDRNREALEGLINGKLKNSDTWEAKLSKAGQTGVDKDEAKAEAWGEMLSSGKMGYMALLKNVRNLMDQADDKTWVLALQQLVDENRIKKSMVMPYRYMSAIDAIFGHSPAKAQRKNAAIAALRAALETSLSSAPEFRGKTCVVLDESGSMTSERTHGGQNVAEVGGLFAAAILKTNPRADILLFDTTARYADVPKTTRALGLDQIRRAIGIRNGGGTDLSCAFRGMNKKYDTIIILSDMQTWVDGMGGPAGACGQYCANYQANPNIVSFDLKGYGQAPLPKEKVFLVAGFSDKVFDIIDFLDEDPDVWIRTVEAVEFNPAQKLAKPAKLENI